MSKRRRSRKVIRKKGTKKVYVVYGKRKSRKSRGRSTVVLPLV